MNPGRLPIILVTVEGDYGLHESLSLRSAIDSNKCLVRWRLLVHSGIIPFALLSDLYDSKEALRLSADNNKLIAPKDYSSLWELFLAKHGWSKEEYYLFDGVTPIEWIDMMMGQAMPLFEFMQDCFEEHKHDDDKPFLFYRANDYKAMLIRKLYEEKWPGEITFQSCASSEYLKGGNVIAYDNYLFIGSAEYQDEQEAATFISNYQAKCLKHGFKAPEMICLGAWKGDSIWERSPLYHLDLFLSYCPKGNNPKGHFLLAEIIYLDEKPSEADEIEAALDLVERQLIEQGLSLKRTALIYYVNGYYYSYCNHHCIDGKVYLPYYDDLHRLPENIQSVFNRSYDRMLRVMEQHGILYCQTKADYSWMMKYRAASMHCHAKCLSAL